MERASGRMSRALVNGEHDDVRFSAAAAGVHGASAAVSSSSGGAFLFLVCLHTNKTACGYRCTSCAGTGRRLHPRLCTSARDRRFRRGSDHDYAAAKPDAKVVLVLVLLVLVLLVLVLLVLVLLVIVLLVVVILVLVLLVIVDLPLDLALDLDLLFLLLPRLLRRLCV